MIQAPRNNPLSDFFTRAKPVFSGPTDVKFRDLGNHTKYTVAASTLHRQFTVHINMWSRCKIKTRRSADADKPVRRV